MKRRYYVEVKTGNATVIVLAERDEKLDPDVVALAAKHAAVEWNEADK